MSKNSEWTITYKQLGLIVFSFSLGLIAALLISNSQSDSTTSFSTTELIGFVLSVILSGASIVLAISAIALGRSSEQAVIERSDESIRLQNEVFVKTTEALQRIEASTGVTEKRIEDIITGRVGDISQKIAGLASSSELSSSQSKKELEEEIKSTLLSAIKGSKDFSDSEDQFSLMMKKRQEREEIYEEHHKKIMDTCKAIPNILVGKVGHGSPSKKGDDQIDGIFVLNNERIGVSTFRYDVDEEVMEEYFRGAATQIESGNFARIYAFGFDANFYEKKAIEILRPFKDELRERILAVGLDTKNMDLEGIKSIISNQKSQSDA